MYEVGRNRQKKNKQKLPEVLEKWESQYGIKSWQQKEEKLSVRKEWCQSQMLQKSQGERERGEKMVQ